MGWKHYSAYIMICLCCMLLGCGSKQDSLEDAETSPDMEMTPTSSPKITFPKGVVVFVNGQPILQDELVERLHTTMRQAELASSPDSSTLSSLRKESLEALIENVLIAQKAEEQKISVTDEEFRQRVQQVQAEYNGRDIQGILQEQGHSYAEWERAQWEALLLEKLVDVNLGILLTVTEVEMLQYYEENKEKYDYPDQIRASQILTYEKQRAEQALEEIRNGADFVQVARKYSESSDAETGGDLGFFAKEVMPPEFDKAILSLKMGEVSEIIQTSYGYQIFKLTGRREAHRLSFEEAKKQIRALLQRRKRMAAGDLLIEKLQQSAKILLNHELIEQVE